MLTALIAAAALTAHAPAEPAPNPMLTSISPAELRSIMAAQGGRVVRVESEGDGFIAWIVFANGLRANVETYWCEGSGETQACPEFRLNAGFTTRTQAEAEAAVLQVQTVWLSGQARGAGFIVGRMEMLQGGVGRAHLDRTFATFEQIASRGLEFGRQ